MLPVSTGKMVSDWYGRAGVRLHSRRADDLYFVQAFSKGLMPALENPANPDMLHAIWLTVLIALITVPVNTVFGTLLAGW